QFFRSGADQNQGVWHVMSYWSHPAADSSHADCGGWLTDRLWNHHWVCARGRHQSDSGVRDQSAVFPLDNAAAPALVVARDHGIRHADGSHAQRLSGEQTGHLPRCCACRQGGLVMRLLMLLVFLLAGNPLLAAERSFETVTPGYEMVFPQDFGAHPDFRIEWWYATGWLQTTEGQQLGFQITFFRIATNAEKNNPSRFAPGQLIIAHAALSDPALDSLLHDQRIRR